MASSRPSQFTLTSAGPCRLYSTRELLERPAPEWLVENMIQQESLAVLYSPPGVGKSFCAMSMAMSIASGLPWAGLRTVHQYVVYIGAEGGSGIGKRVAAWLHKNERKPADLEIAWLLESVPLYADRDGHAEGLEALTNRIEFQLRKEPGLIVVDTLARCFDGDENQQLDMGRFIAACDYLRTEYCCAVLVVHHTRLDGERERGNTALRGAADTMLSLTRLGRPTPTGGPLPSKETRIQKLELTCNKQKDAVEFDPIRLHLVPCPEFDSAIITLAGINGRPSLAGQREAKILRILEDKGPLSFTDLLHESLIPKASFARLVSGLEVTRCIQKTSGDLWDLVSQEKASV